MTFDVVYLARHGQTQWNRERRKQGQLDSPLSAAGRTHAENLSQAAASFDVDLIASSPIGRALTTAEICAHALGLSVVVVAELAEVHHGAMAGLTTSEASARFPGALELRAMDKYEWRFPGGESYADGDLRAGIALDRIARTGARRPLIVSHEMIGRMLRRNLLDSRPADVLSTNQPHDVVLRVDPSSGHIDELSTVPSQPVNRDLSDGGSSRLPHFAPAESAPHEVRPMSGNLCGVDRSGAKSDLGC